MTFIGYKVYVHATNEDAFIFNSLKEAKRQARNISAVTRCPIYITKVCRKCRKALPNNARKHC